MQELKIALRMPIFPVIIISKDKLFAGRTLKSLEKYLRISIPKEEEDEVVLIDSDVEEFWFKPEEVVLMPGIPIYNKWTKKEIINLFNNSSNAKKLGIKYPLQSLSRKKVRTIIKEICDLIERSLNRGRRSSN
jgi:hypothetical protein